MHHTYYSLTYVKKQHQTREKYHEKTENFPHILCQSADGAGCQQKGGSRETRTAPGAGENA